VPTEGISQGLAGEQVDLAAKYLSQLGNHVYPIIKAPLRIGSERYQQIDVAVGAEVIPKRRTEDREVSDSPLSTESADTLYGNWNSDLSHAEMLSPISEGNTNVTKRKPGEMVSKPFYYRGKSDSPPDTISLTPLGTHAECPYEIKSTEISSRRKICPYSPSLWSPSCSISAGVLSCG